VIDPQPGPHDPRVGLTGVEEVFTINNALGLLIDSGHHPDTAPDHLQRGQPRSRHLHSYAQGLLNRPDVTYNG